MNINITDPIFHDETKAVKHVFDSRWPDGEPICPHCGSTRCREWAARHRPVTGFAMTAATSSPSAPER